MNFQDCEIKGVRQDGRDFLILKLVVKREDYTDAEYMFLHDKEVAKETVDVQIGEAECTKEPVKFIPIDPHSNIDPLTGELTN